MHTACSMGATFTVLPSLHPPLKPPPVRLSGSKTLFWGPPARLNLPS